MDRRIIWPGAQPLDEDLLLPQRYAMEALGRLIWSLMGSTFAAHGLACAQQATPNMSVLVGPGSIYAQAPVDQTAFGSLAPDTTHQIIKQGVLRDNLTIPLTAPVTVGHSINYLIQAGLSDADSDALVLPFFNVDNPAQSLLGPDGQGATVMTTRKCLCTVNAKPGTSASTGTQTTPSPDAGFNGIYVVTVAYGATTVVNANIATVSPNPFLRAPSAQSAQRTAAWTYAADTGTANALVVTLDPAPTVLPRMLTVLKGSNNNSGATTINPNGLGAVSVVDKAGSALTSGGWPANTIRMLVLNGAGNAYQMIGA